MKYFKEISLVVSGVTIGFIFGGVSVINAELKSKTIRTAFSKALAEKIADIMFGMKKADSKVSYRRYYESCPSRQIDNFILPNRGEAESVIDNMLEIQNTYGVVTVADLHDLVGYKSNYSDNRYGWTDLTDVSIVRARSGYELKLPRAIPLN